MVLIEESRDLRRTDASVKVVSLCGKYHVLSFVRVEGDALFFCRVCTEWCGCCTRFADCYLIGSVGLTFDVNIISAVGCGMDLNTVGVIGGVRGESGAEIWAGF